MISANSILPVHVSGHGVDARGDPKVSDNVEFVANKKRRRCEWCTSVEPPCHMRSGDIAGAVDADSEQRRCVEACRKVHHAVSKNRSRYVREAILIADAPDFLTGGWVVRGCTKRGDADDLFVVSDTYDEGSGVRLRDGIRTSSAPPFLSRLAIDRNNVGSVIAIDIKH